MSGVVLRCPNCGTVQPTSGECEACREAQVRYFCSNHVPGVWVDSPSCPQCGARFGDPAPARETPPPPERRPARPPEVAERRPIEYGRDDVGPWGGEGPAGPRGPGGDHRAGPDAASLLLAMLGAAARARRGRSEGFGYEVEAPRRRRGGGCIGRLLILALLLFALFLMAPFLLGALLGFR